MRVSLGDEAARGIAKFLADNETEAGPLRVQVYRDGAPGTRGVDGLKRTVFGYGEHEERLVQP
jgi:Fe-S cluster assembly iron-binding protein IscA